MLLIMLLRMFKLGFIVDILKRRYTAYYVEKLPLEQVDIDKPNEKDLRLRDAINQARIDIYHGGIIRPMVVYKNDGKSTAGGVYAQALKGLGRTFVPAIIVDYDDPEDLPGKPVRSIKDAKRYFPADYDVYMTHKDFSVKKRQ